MFTSTESRLWLAVHLLYPSASQAFDVYQAVVQQSENHLNRNNNEAVFAKLVQAFEKIPAISSNLSFYEFEFDQIDQWKVIYKNSQKIQLVIFVGVLIFEMKMSDIAPLLRLTADKAQFLFHQIFKKLAQNSSKLKYNEQLNFKKQNDLKISYLYTYENLIEYCLGQLSAEEHEKVKAGLELYPILQLTKDEYSKIISQIQNLKVQRSASAAGREQNFSDLQTSAVTETKNRPFYAKKRNWAALAVVCLATAAGIFYATGILPYWLGRDETLVIQALNEAPAEAPVYPDIAAESVPKEAPSTEGETASGDVSVADSEPVAEPAPAIEPPVAAIEPKPEPKPEPKTEPKPAAATQFSLPAEPGGLYRGTLRVEDVVAVNARMQQKMSQLGAAKAGEVELGWMKTDKIAYYHFTISEKNIAEAHTFFEQLGKLNLKFDKHPRSLPAGTRRFIIEVEQK